VSWRRIMRVGRRSGLSSAVMSQLADAMLAFMDELASVALDGYLEAKARTAGALDTWRRKLLHLILETPPASPKAIAELAQLIGWPVPTDATPVAVCPADGVAPARRHAGLDADILAELDTPDPKLVVPGELSGARLATLQVALPDCRLSIGPCVPLASVADSLRWARNALQLTERGVLMPRPVLRAEEHLATLLVNSDTGLVGTLRHRLFAPLADMTGKQQERLLETLRAWLDSQGNVVEIAERLGVHPQTVRYRMRQLQATFGDSLRDPASRFEMELALRAGAAPLPLRYPVSELLPSQRAGVPRPQWTSS
jgi:hypothetical protein